VGFIPLSLFDLESEEEENPLLDLKQSIMVHPEEGSTAINNHDSLLSEVDEMPIAHLSRMSQNHIDHDFELEIVITDAMDAATQRY